MLNKKLRNEIIDRLNMLFNDYEELSSFCNNLDNNVNKVIEMINKIIKYAFVHDKFIYDKKTLYALSNEIKDVDDLYKEFLRKSNKKKLFLSITKKAKIEFSATIPLDDDIRKCDINGLVLPTKERLIQICNDNIAMLESEKEKRSEREKYYRKERGFDKTAFVYTRKEFITIDSSFIYYRADLSGDINTDFDKLYSDSRYGKTDDELNPLNNSYEENIQKIKTKNDIFLRKRGNVYEIENGRHRILYLLKNGREVIIPAIISKRIEDREFNIILNDLKEKYDIKIYKNNLLNDDPNILLVFNQVVYEIENKDELKLFYNNLEKGIANDILMSFSFKNVFDDNKRIIMDNYKKMIFKKFLEVGEKILTSNFSGVVKFFENVDVELFYDAFISIQLDYQDSLVFQYDFRKLNEDYYNDDSYGDKKNLGESDKKIRRK